MRHLVWILVVASALCLTGCQRSAPAAAVQTGAVAAPAPSAPPYDHALTDVARLLAGMAPEEEKAFANVTSRPSWQEYHAAMDANWASERQGRFQTIAAWRDKELAAPSSTCRALLYPFGGPDILHARLLFPRCHTYVLFGLERLGSVRPLGQLPADRVDRLVADLRESLSDLFKRHYFITKDMMADLGEGDLDGITPILLLLLAREDARIVGVDRVELSARGASVLTAASGVTPDAKVLVGSRVRFLDRDGEQPREVIYFRAPADDAGLARRPAVEAYLRHLAPATTMLKSASYLLHTQTFSKMRSIILDSSAVILEDDSGLPYRFLNSPAWRVTLYGQYAKPIPDFNYGFQSDLQAAYEAAAPTRPLTFSYGYHWRDQAWGVILAVRAAGTGR